MSFTFPAAPTPPSTGSPATFQQRADDFVNWMSTVATTIAAAGELQALDDFDIGSNANGNYAIIPGGLQVCWHSLTLSQQSINYCNASWTFPAAFSAPASAFFVPDRGNWSITPGANELGASLVRLSGAASVEFEQWRVDGKTDFGAGDTMTVDAFAIGLS
ncbi:hypothetical protein [Leisingera sp. ANG-Vp]|uniref:hypothetical protein n=1 Tax=Leisingera sp. ANG-Vp TaxID=1577896 RepID=UPI00057EE8BD|nr:hypothetical protein [Leisingera sp. ANG-Vp]KIC22514.1 hypothetical protein RA20_01150 [Leisingera sp. ANG-Vp]